MYADQKGMTLWSTTFVLGVLGIAVFLILKLFPVYMQDFKVRKALHGIAAQSGAEAMTKADFVDALDKRLMVDDVENVNARKHFTIEQSGKNKLLRVNYEAIVPLVYNVSALLEFDHSQEVRGD